MSIVLVDTDVTSFLFKGDSRAALYEPDLVGKEIALSYMTYAELYQWAYTQKWGQKRLDALAEHLKSFTLLPIDLEICRLWGHLRAELRQKGIVITPQDGWIAATALFWGVPLVTNNAKDYRNLPNLVLITHTTSQS